MAGGFRYGTLLCDLEKHRPIDLLPSRDKDLVANWFKRHSGIGVISRDRAGDYAHAIGEGAPQATSVADRWHLIHNLCQTLPRILDQHPREFREISKAQAALKLHSGPDVPWTPSHPCPTQVTRSQTIKEERRARRLKRYQEVIELYREGKSYRSIARQLNLHRMTVARYVQAGSFP